MEPRPLAPHRRRLAGVRHGRARHPTRATSIAAGAPATAPTSRTSAGWRRCSTASTSSAATRSSRSTSTPRCATSTPAFDVLTLTDKALPLSTASAANATSTDRDGAHRPRVARTSSSTREPSVFTIVNTNSPLTLDMPMSHGIIEMARANQVTCVTPFTLAGAMAPITLAGALAQQNAEALAGIAADPDRAAGEPVHLRRVHEQRRHAVRAHRRSARPSTGRRRSSAASWRAATACRTAAATCAPPMPSTPRPRTSRCSRCGARHGRRATS